MQEDPPENAKTRFAHSARLWGITGGLVGASIGFVNGGAVAAITGALGGVLVGLAVALISAAGSRWRFGKR